MKKYKTMELYLDIMRDINTMQEKCDNDTTLRLAFANYMVETITMLEVFWNGTEEGKNTTGDSDLWEDVLKIIERKTKPSKANETDKVTTRSERLLKEAMSFHDELPANINKQLKSWKELE